MAGTGASAFTDAQLGSLINVATDLVKRTLHWDIELQSYLEYYDGESWSSPDDAVLILRQSPVLSVQRVCVDDQAYFGQSPTAFPAANDLVAGVDYAIMAGVGGIGSSGCLRRIGSVWWRRRSWQPGKVAPQASSPSGNILVQYMAGYSPVPYGIQFAVNQTVLDVANRMLAGGIVASEAYEDASQSYFSPEIMLKVYGSVQQTLGVFRSIVV